MTTTPERVGAPPLDDYDRHLPAPTVLDAERQVVGAALLTRTAAEAAAETLGPGDFFDAKLALIFQAVTELASSGQRADAVTVAHHLTRTGQIGMLRPVGPVLLHKLAGAVVNTHTSAVLGYADIVAEDAHRRLLHTAFTRGAAATGTAEYDPEAADRLVAAVTQAATRSRTDNEAAWLADDLAATLDDLENGRDDDLIPTPWADINQGAGLRPGQLVIVGADTGGGKSLFGLNAAAHTAIRRKEGALLASLEMSRTQLQRRLLAAEAAIDLGRLEQRKPTADDWNAVARVLPRIQEAPLLIDDSAEITVARLRARVRHMRTKVTTRLVVVDYLQLMPVGKRAERRDLEVAALTRALKLMARDLGVCVIALSQLNRAPGQRADKRPQLSDLRESGAIEQDADTVILLHRPEPDGPKASEIDLIVAKQRSGPRFTVTANFQGHLARIVDLAKPEWTPHSTVDGQR